MRYCKLRQKEVVNILEGTSLGYIVDLVLDGCSGKISAIIVPGDRGMKHFFKCKNYVIPWKCICKIGDDVILVEVDLNLCATAE